ncbi:MAG: hypothetical protein PGN13_13535 [Patulibacter minatonensis]
MSPLGPSGTLAPAQIEVRVRPAGEFTVEPTGTVLKATAFPQPGERGGPTMAVALTNITGAPMQVSVRLLPVAPALDEVATLRGSVAGALVLTGALGRSAGWTAPAGLVASGATTTLRIRFKLRKGIDPDRFAGRLDIRQIEVRGTPVGKELDTSGDVQKVVPGTEGTTPATSPSGADATAPAEATPRATAAPTITPEPRDPDAPNRRAPDDEGTE